MARRVCRKFRAQFLGTEEGVYVESRCSSRNQESAGRTETPRRTLLSNCFRSLRLLLDHSPEGLKHALVFPPCRSGHRLVLIKCVNATVLGHNIADSGNAGRIPFLLDCTLTKGNSLTGGREPPCPKNVGFSYVTISSCVTM